MTNSHDEEGNTKCVLEYNSTTTIAYDPLVPSGLVVIAIGVLVTVVIVSSLIHFNARSVRQ
jgi:hypothetical protein